MLILTTERLRLRWFRADDAAFLLRLVNDPDWLANIGDRSVHDEDAARAYVQDRLVDGCWRMGFGFWLVERTHDGERLGMCGLTHRESLPEPDLGFAFLPQFRGQGYAVEAARACLRYADEVLELDAVLAITAPHNVRSQGLLQKLGMVVDPSGPRRDADGECVRWHWRRAEVRTCDDAAAIERLVQRFHRLFDNRGPQPMTLPILSQLCVPQVRFRSVDADAVVDEDLRAFVQGRATRLAAELAGHHEREVSARTERHGAVAQRWSQFVAAGVRHGEPVPSSGFRSLQFVRSARGWRIAAVASVPSLAAPR